MPKKTLGPIVLETWRYWTGKHRLRVRENGEIVSEWEAESGRWRACTDDRDDFDHLPEEPFHA